MTSSSKHILSSNEYPTNLVKQLGIVKWSDLITYVRMIPYGRNTNRTDFGLVISQNKGTCSSKHALLKTIADQNDIPNVKLILCIYRMTDQNTPGIDLNNLSQDLDYIPEAHCYIDLGDNKVDVTNMNSDLSNIEFEILEEREIHPSEVAEKKVTYHKQFIKEWLALDALTLSFKEVWNIREKCIVNLTNNG